MYNNLNKYEKIKFNPYSKIYLIKFKSIPDKKLNLPDEPHKAITCAKGRLRNGLHLSDFDWGNIHVSSKK